MRWLILMRWLFFLQSNRGGIAGKLWCASWTVRVSRWVVPRDILWHSVGKNMSVLFCFCDFLFLRTLICLLARSVRSVRVGLMSDFENFKIVKYFFPFFVSSFLKGNLIFSFPSYNLVHGFYLCIQNECGLSPKWMHSVYSKWMHSNFTYFHFSIRYSFIRWPRTLVVILFLASRPLIAHRTRFWLIPIPFASPLMPGQQSLSWFSCNFSDIKTQRSAGLKPVQWFHQNSLVTFSQGNFVDGLAPEAGPYFLALISSSVGRFIKIKKLTHCTVWAFLFLSISF